MRILVTPTFKRAIKKLHKREKSGLDEAVKTIAATPEIGTAKVGDLSGILIHKFHISNQLTLLAYRIIDSESLKLLAFGPHENFYRDLKRLDS